MAKTKTKPETLTEEEMIASEKARLQEAQNNVYRNQLRQLGIIPTEDSVQEEDGE